MAIVAASMSLFVVLSVFSGLKDLSLSLTNQADPDLKITSKTGKTLILDKEFLENINRDNIEKYTAIIDEKALLRYKGKDVIVDLKGVDTNFLAVNDYEASLQLGKWVSENSSGVVVGSGVAQKLSLAINDQENPLEVIVPKTGKISQVRLDQAFVSEYLIGVGTFFNTEEANNKYAFVDIDLAKSILGFKDNEVSAVAIKVNKPENINAAKKELIKSLGENFVLKTRTELNESLHRMLNTENLVLYLIFLLIIFMVMFTLYGTLLMTIIEKKGNIKTLFSLGMTLQKTRFLFMFQGSFVCFFGGLIGLFIGLIIVWLQENYLFVMINDYLPYPVVLNFFNVFIVMGTISVIGVFMSWLASISINKNFLAR